MNPGNKNSYNCILVISSEDFDFKKKDNIIAQINILNNMSKKENVLDKKIHRS